MEDNHVDLEDIYNKKMDEEYSNRGSRSIMGNVPLYREELENICYNLETALFAAHIPFFVRVGFFIDQSMEALIELYKGGHLPQEAILELFDSIYQGKREWALHIMQIMDDQKSSS